MHSLFSYPEAWKYPVQLALDAANDKKTLTPCNKMTTLPASLPVTCSAVHLHKWKSQVRVKTAVQYNLNLKLVINKFAHLRPWLNLLKTAFYFKLL